jgi:hypothetical protein
MFILGVGVQEAGTWLTVIIIGCRGAERTGQVSYSLFVGSDLRFIIIVIPTFVVRFLRR